MKPPRIRRGGWVDERWRHRAAQRTRAAEAHAAVADQELRAGCSPGHVTPAGGENIPGITIEDNQHEDCLSIRYVDPDSGEHDVIHFCDWPALRAAIDQHQRERGGRA